ncbi:hypothetical protein GC163_22380 [bacterium]|nr:hypothetical protein [bacterium]
MQIATWLMMSAFLQGPTVDVTTLAGESLKGQLRSLSAEHLELDRDGTPLQIPTSDLLQLQVSSSATDPAVNSGPIELELRDGSRLRGTQLTATDGELRLQHPVFQELRLPRDRVHSVRLLPDDAVVRGTWRELVSRTKKQDYLVVRKSDVLDHLDGVIGALSDESLKFLFDGDQIDVKRARIFGWIYADLPPSKSSPTVRIDLGPHDVLQVAAVRWSPAGWELQLTGQKPIQVPTESLSSIDFSAGKVLYLSTVEPRDVEQVHFWGNPEFPFPYQRDRNLFGQPLRVGTRTFARGLSLHSKTRLVYRLGGDYRKLTATVGLDPDLEPQSDPKATVNRAQLVIRGDRKILWDAEVKAGDPPVNLDLPVTDVIELEILVDYGPGISYERDVGDRVHLADLKVLK